MKFLIVYGHPNPKSFNQAILETLSASLQEAGHDIEIRDLYKMSFDPVLKGPELEGFQKGVFPEDVLREQQHVAWTDILVFISPIWWGGMTSILRGYFDRVFAMGFAYRFGTGGLEGLLTSKKALVINTIGASRQEYESTGVFRSLNQTMDETVFQFCGMEVLGHHYFCSVTTCSAEERGRMLDDVKALGDQWTS